MRGTPLLLIIVLPLVVGSAEKDTCYECHLRLRGKLKAPAVLWQNDVHRLAGMNCTLCHKGDASNEDLKGSKTNEFIGTFHRAEIPKLCGNCHQDAERIHKSNPKLPVDQLSQFVASAHGKKLAAGDDAPATCIDCHSVHDTRKANDPLSPVSALRQAETCGRCHSNPDIMASRNLPVNQLANYQQGGHWMRLSMRGDAKAARCASCHGDHNTPAAKSPAVATSCKQCHGPDEQVYADRAHFRISVEERAKGCVGCHGNHKVSRRPGGRGGRGGRGGFGGGPWGGRGEGAAWPPQQPPQ